MLVLKRFIWNVLGVFVFLRFRTLWDLYEHIAAKGLKKGVLVSVFLHNVDAKCGYIGLGCKFLSRPYFPHGVHGVFISNQAVIGKNAVIYQGVTIGSVLTKGSSRAGSPVIGDNCYIGAGAKIIGNVHIGNNCRIGANAVVYQDMPDNSIAVCSPTRIITREQELDNRFFKLDEQGQLVYWDHGVFRKEN